MSGAKTKAALGLKLLLRKAPRDDDDTKSSVQDLYDAIVEETDPDTLEEYRTMLSGNIFFYRIHSSLSTHSMPKPFHNTTYHLYILYVYRRDQTLAMSTQPARFPILSHPTVPILHTRACILLYIGKFVFIHLCYTNLCISLLYIFYIYIYIYIDIELHYLEYMWVHIIIRTSYDIYTF